MVQITKGFSGFSVNDMAAAEKFYGEVLGIDAKQDEMGLNLKLEGTHVFIYPKQDHIPATYTVLNFEVDNIDEAVDELTGKGIVFEHYPEMTDEKGVARGRAHNMGPDIAWFKDPAGNILSILC